MCDSVREGCAHWEGDRCSGGDGECGNPVEVCLNCSEPAVVKRCTCTCTLIVYTCKIYRQMRYMYDILHMYISNPELPFELHVHVLGEF